MGTGHEAALYYDLVAAQRETAGDTGCPLCRYIVEQGDGATRDALASAAAGTIGIRKLETILQRYEARDPKTNKPVGRRTIARHRSEEHRP